MTCELVALCIDAQDPSRLARFWSQALGRELVEDPDDGVLLLAGADPSFRIRFLPTVRPKSGPNQMHFDLTSDSVEDQRQTVELALDLGARHLDVGQGPDAAHVVLADPEGNEFCVIEPGNSFLEGCGFLGAIASDGSAAVGRFWSAALGWPLVWDQDQETAIQAPAGGTKITWGGPPLAPKAGKYRLHFDIAPTVGEEQPSAVEHLVALGARYADIGQGDVAWVVMVDPDGHEFCVLPPQQRTGRRRSTAAV